MKNVILLRHGITRCNLEKSYCGITDVPLCPEGREDLLRLKSGRRFPDITGYRAFTSGLARTDETLTLLFGDIPFTPEPAFREMDFGEFECKTYEALKEREDYNAWISGDVTKNRCPGGESAAQMAQRVRNRFYALLSEEEQHLLIVTHGGPISQLMLHLFPGQRTHWSDWQPANGCGYLLTFESKTVYDFRELPF